MMSEQGELSVIYALHDINVTLKQIANLLRIGISESAPKNKSIGEINHLNSKLDAAMENVDND